VANALVLKSIKTMSAVSGAVQGLCSDVRDVKTGIVKVDGEVKAGFFKVQGEVKQGTTEVKKLAASVDANNRQQLKDKDAQIKRLQEDKQTLQEANERQRVQIAKLNKERNDLLKAPTSSDPKLIALCERVDGISRSLAGVNTVAFNSREKMSTLGRDMQAMHATATAQLKDLQEIKAFLAAITAAIAP
jgi:DNA repair exonuclease SbcCD ATPase subunit